MGGKGDIDIDITGGADPRDDYAPMNAVLDTEWATFEDGAGDVELMAFGDWVNAGGPPWYYEFTTLTLSDYDYFGFSDYLFYTNEVISIGALAADGDYFLSTALNRVYIYGISGAAPTSDGYMHACSNQLTLIGAGPLDMPEEEYSTDPDGLGIKRIGAFTGDTYRYTNISQVMQLYTGSGGKVHGHAQGSSSDAEYPSETERLGFWYSDDHGVTWNWSNQIMYKEPFEWDQPFPDPPEFHDANSDDTPYGGQDAANIGNSLGNTWPAGINQGLIPMSGDGQLMVYMMEGSATTAYFWTADGGVNWRKGPQINFTGGYRAEYSYQLATPANRFEAAGWCRDARVIKDPHPLTGWPWVIYGVDRRTPGNQCIVKIDFAKTKAFPDYLFFWADVSGKITKGGASLATIQASGNVFGNSRPFHISSTYDVIADKMWLHVLGKSSTNQTIYSRSDDEGATWTNINLISTHDPDYVASGGTSIQRGLRTTQWLNTFVSPDCRTLWAVIQFGENPSGPFTNYGSQHLYRSVDHGVTWDKLTQGINGWPYSGGFSIGAGGYLNAQGIGNVHLMFLNDDMPQTKMIATFGQWHYQDFYYWEFNQTGSHAGLVADYYPVQQQVREVNGYFSPGATFWGTGLPSYPCGFDAGDRPWQVVDEWHIRGGNKRDIDPTGGNCTGGGSNPYRRGSYNEMTIAPTDATFYNICDEAGFIIRAQHINELKTKLQQLNNTVQAMGTNPTKFGIDFIMPDGNTLPVIQPNNEAQPVRADHYTTLRREFETKIRSEVGTGPGGWVYTDEGVDLTDSEYNMPSPSDDGFTGVSIRTLLGMRKIIQALYTNGWFCACYSYCPCQTDITVSGGGSKK